MSHILTEEDKDISAKFIVLGLLVDTLEREKQSIAASTIRMQNPFLELVEVILKKVRMELIETKRIMGKKGIKVFNREVVNEDFWVYKYLVRGYNSEFRFLKYALKMMMENKMRDYLALEKNNNN
ncbi:hypothetical protein ACFVAD_19060 [Sutcliffiella sp. NPDC057660]|uniref:hypothetical protein n=1 Tax=Sutcliffiella sp. NPDC057660 TaxID=3346199 RepID=UPI0036C190DE